MFASLYNYKSGNELPKLLQIANQFSPEVETFDESTVIFSIQPLRALLGPPPQIAAEICRCGFEQDLNANLAIAANPDTAILLARHVAGVTFVTPGEEQMKLAALPLECLLQHAPHINPKVFAVLHRWGLRTCGELSSLDARGIAERLGSDGTHLRNLAGGWVNRPLLLPSQPPRYEAQMQLEHPLEVLEPLLFLLGSSLRDLCAKLRAQFLGAGILKLRLQLEGGQEHISELEFPAPLEEASTLLKLLHLHLESHMPGAAVIGFHVCIEPAVPKRTQAEFFIPPVPLPDRLELTLARIRGLVGSANVITPQLLNTHRPDAFRAGSLEIGDGKAVNENQEGHTQVLRLAMRLFRPALPARVKILKQKPGAITAHRIRGQVVHCAGPWKTSGEWWTESNWMRVEWDVALNDGGRYRIYQESASKQWFVQGMYD